MSQTHGCSPFDLSFKAGEAALATSTAEYLTVYLSGDNEVKVINTTTNYSKAIGVVQAGGQANALNGAVTVRTFGPSKAKFSGANTVTAAGLLVGCDVATTTAHGHLQLQTLNVTDATAGSAFIFGRALEASGATGTISEIFINPQFSSAITTTVES